LPAPAGQSYSKWAWACAAARAIDSGVRPRDWRTISRRRKTCLASGDRDGANCMMLLRWAADSGPSVVSSVEVEVAVDMDAGLYQVTAAARRIF